MTVSRNAQQMGKLIDDLLSFSRLSRKEMHMSRNQYGARWQRMYGARSKKQIPSRAMEFKVGKMAPAFGDPSLIRQVVVNLLSNAVKFTRDRRPAVIETGAAMREREISILREG